MSKKKVEPVGKKLKKNKDEEKKHDDNEDINQLFPMVHNKILEITELECQRSKL